LTAPPAPTPTLPTAPLLSTPTVVRERHLAPPALALSPASVAARWDAVVLLGHGSLAAESGVAMFRLAEELRERGVAPMVTAGFLNLSEPTIDQSVARCVDAGARRLLVVPYFLIAGKYVREDVPAVLQRIRDRYAAVDLAATGHLGDHAQLAWLALDRAEACVGRRLRTDDAVVLLAHGSPYNDANEDIERAAARLRCRDIATTVGYMELNRPTIADAVAGALAAGSATVVAVPFFLHLGRHVKHDLPGLMGGIQRRYPERRVLLSAHLGYDASLTTVVQDRVLAHVSACVSTR